MAFGAKIKLSVNTSNATAFRAEIQKLVNTATANNPIKLRNIEIKVSNPAAQLTSIQKQLNQKGGLVVNLKEVNAKGAINKLRNDIQTMLKGLNIVGLKEFLSSDGIDDVAGSINRAKADTSEWAAQLKVVDSIQQKLKNTYKSALSGKGQGNIITDSSIMNETTSAYTAWQQKVEQLRSSRAALSEEEITALQREGIAIQQKITLIQTEQAERIKASNDAKKAIEAEAKAEEAAAKKELLASQQAISLKSQIHKWTLANSKAYQANSEEIDGMIESLRPGSKITGEELKAIRGRFTEIGDSARAAGLSGNTFFETMQKGWAKFGGWALVTKSMMLAFRTIKDMVVAVKELDAAMIELRKVTELSEATYDNYIQTAMKMSQAVGATLSDTINATADFAKLGYDLTDSASLAEAALVYKNVGDGIRDISEASESLISTIKAFGEFGVTANDAMSIVDKFNEVGEIVAQWYSDISLVSGYIG